MPYVTCACGLTFDPSSGPGACPKCGKSALPPDGPIRFSCPLCGLRLTSTARYSGKTVDCLACGRPATVPAATSRAPETARLPSTTRRSAPATVRQLRSRPDGWRSVARWSLLAALVPLGFFTFAPPDDLKNRIEETRKMNPEATKPFRGLDLTERELAALPSHRLEGAAFSRSTSAHWGIALLTALIFWEFILIVQPMGNSTSRQLWAVGIFTGTIGILMLLMITIGAILAAVLNVPVLKYLGYSYGAATDPRNGFIPSMLGFTIGVGFLEELCKALPLYWHFRKSARLDARGAVVWGLATGIGFGVSEGISYSGSFYNGISGGGMYVVRFISCVALHAVWSGTVAILIWRRHESIQNLGKIYQWVPIVFSTLASSMVIHGFYDTCIKKEYGSAALASAVLSFALFFWLYDRACREERTKRPAPDLA